MPWTAVEQPDFPGKKVQIGGFKPFLLLNPPAKELDSLAEKHLEFVWEFSGLLPQLALSDVKVESLGAGVYRVSCTALNTGYLPTMCEMGRINGAAYPLQIELRLPDGTKSSKATRATENQPTCRPRRQVRSHVAGSYVGRQTRQWKDHGSCAGGR